MRVAVIIACLASAGCTTPAYVPATTKKILTAAEISLVKEGIRDVLNYPDSAMFGKIAASRNTAGKVYVCGDVSLRSGLGGYTGRTPFMGMMVNVRGQKTFKATGMGGTEYETDSVTTLCRRYGVI
ncbi:MAG TPA: hypothetical protein VGO22_17160 [Pseudorhizobium sp.]|jgi:hypothetical protein|nr:hypothetical protein [Pseudorhizobium sp.]